MSPAPSELPKGHCPSLHTPRGQIALSASPTLHEGLWVGQMGSGARREAEHQLQKYL